MTQLRDALAHLLTVDMVQAKPIEMATLGNFLERATEELLAREAAVADRENVVSAREAALTVREEQLAENEQSFKAKLQTLDSVQRVRKTLVPVSDVRQVRRWWR